MNFFGAGVWYSVDDELSLAAGALEDFWDHDQIECNPVSLGSFSPACGERVGVRGGLIPRHSST
jgi:hypothetical protein